MTPTSTCTLASRCCASPSTRARPGWRVSVSIPNCSLMLLHSAAQRASRLTYIGMVAVLTGDPVYRRQWYKTWKSSCSSSLSRNSGFIWRRIALYKCLDKAGYQRGMHTAIGRWDIRGQDSPDCWPDHHTPPTLSGRDVHELPRILLLPVVWYSHGLTCVSYCNEFSDGGDRIGSCIFWPTTPLLEEIHGWCVRLFQQTLCPASMTISIVWTITFSSRWKRKKMESSLFWMSFWPAIRMA